MSDSIRVYVVPRTGRKYLYLVARDLETNWEKWKSARTRNQRDADRAAAKWEAELREGRYKPKSKTTWEEFTERYLTEVASGLAIGTQSKIRSAFKSIHAHTGVKLLSALNADRISKWQNSRRQGGDAETTIKSVSAHILAALNWAKDVGLISDVPIIRMPQRAKNSKIMRGRPITDEEFWLMMACVPKVVGRRRAPSWSWFMHGLLLSGLRISESLELEWDGFGFSLDFSNPLPMLRIPASQEKGFKDRILPIVPEFAEFLDEVPNRERTGFVFSPMKKHGEGRYATGRDAGRTIAKIGETAGVIVDERIRNGEKVIKYASAHDLRRAFGTKWSQEVMPPDLQILMRHETIETTMKYYVGHSAMGIASRIWAKRQTPR